MINVVLLLFLHSPLYYFLSLKILNSYLGPATISPLLNTEDVKISRTERGVTNTKYDPFQNTHQCLQILLTMSVICYIDT